MKLQPMNGFCVIRVGKTAETTPGGLYIPEKAQVRPQVGTVEAHSLPWESAQGVMLTSQLKVGMRVLFNRFAGEAVDSSDAGLLMAKEVDIIGQVVE